MITIPTAEEFLQDHHQISHFYDDKTNNMVCFSDDVQKAMIEFAKFHVQEALKEASKTKVEGHFGSGKYNRDVADKDSILTSYPLTNIK